MAASEGLPQTAEEARASGGFRFGQHVAHAAHGVDLYRGPTVGEHAAQAMDVDLDGIRADFVREAEQVILEQPLGGDVAATPQQNLQNGRLDRLPALKTETAKSIDELRKSPSLAAKSDQLMAELLKVMQDQYGLIEDAQRAGTVTFATFQRLKENTDRFMAVMARFSNWVQTDGARYGIQIGKDH